MYIQFFEIISHFKILKRSFDFLFKNKLFDDYYLHTSRKTDMPPCEKLVNHWEEDTGFMPKAEMESELPKMSDMGKIIKGA